ncbi:MAG: hypothetical protein KJ674_02880 [Nanoarchaeota archaeon]|nr:hypothetical protein [Nanoarchaeota archaeon]
MQNLTQLTPEHYRLIKPDYSLFCFPEEFTIKWLDKFTLTPDEYFRQQGELAIKQHIEANFLNGGKFIEYMFEIWNAQEEKKEPERIDGINPLEVKVFCSEEVKIPWYSSKDRERYSTLSENESRNVNDIMNLIGTLKRRDYKRTGVFLQDVKGPVIDGKEVGFPSSMFYLTP